MLRSVNKPRPITRWIHRGYTPALTLRGLFLQFLTFFSSTRILQDYGDSVYIEDYLVHQYMTEEYFTSTLLETRRQLSRPEQIAMEQQWTACYLAEIDITTYQLHKETVTHCAKTVKGGARVHRLSVVNPRWKATHEVISRRRCEKCLYGSENLHAYRQVQEKSESKNQVVVNLIPPPVCLLGMLNDEISFELSVYIPSEFVLDFSVAYPRFRRPITFTRELLQRELRCFFLRTSIHESVIGIGFALDPKSRRLSSDFDWLSKEAFDQFGVETSIQKYDSKFFLPLAFSHPHFERARKDI
ncbi:hypothetical protein E4T56_gene18521 [Termitomyces sp. T112]|nr:hypothetical protein E4T56_gene18521 [Termitomyces sp. T112]